MPLITRLAVVGVLERDGDPLVGDVPTRARGIDLVAVDVALLLEDPGELALELGRGDRHIVVLGLGARCAAGVRKSATGSVIDIGRYQLLLVMPGM